jgi:hypothetical protein
MATRSDDPLTQAALDLGNDAIWDGAESEEDVAAALIRAGVIIAIEHVNLTGAQLNEALYDLELTSDKMAARTERPR